MLPVLSIGLLSWVPFVYLAVRGGSQRLWRIAGGYIGVTVVMIVLIAVGGSGSHPYRHHSSSGATTAGGLLLIVLAAGGCVHWLAGRAGFERALAADGAEGGLGGVEDPAFAAADARVRSREHALEICRNDPERAKALGIGRPDLPAAYDAGLVDVNHAGVSALVGLPGIDQAAAEKIVSLRDGDGGFSSVEDLDVVLDLPPAVVGDLRARAIFLPR